MERLQQSAIAETPAELEATADRALWRLCEIFRTDLDGLRSMIDEYLRDSLHLIKKMNVALGKGELAVIKNAAHAMKSNALVFGELTLSRACATIESAVANPTKESLETLLAKLSCEQERARILLLAKYRVLVNAITRR